MLVAQRRSSTSHPCGPSIPSTRPAYFRQMETRALTHWIPNAKASVVFHPATDPNEQRKWHFEPYILDAPTRKLRHSLFRRMLSLVSSLQGSPICKEFESCTRIALVQCHIMPGTSWKTPSSYCQCVSKLPRSFLHHFSSCACIARVGPQCVRLKKLLLLEDGSSSRRVRVSCAENK